MRRITYLILYIVLFSGFENKERRPILAMVPTLHNSRTENSLTKSENADILWIQKVLDNWNSACLYELNIELTPLPWIIFYDSSAAWHLNADESMLPPFEKTHHRVEFENTNYLREVLAEHKKL